MPDQVARLVGLKRRDRAKNCRDTTALRFRHFTATVPHFRRPLVNPSFENIPCAPMPSPHGGCTFPEATSYWLTKSASDSLCWWPVRSWSGCVEPTEDRYGRAADRTASAVRQYYTEVETPAQRAAIKMSCAPPRRLTLQVSLCC